MIWKYLPYPNNMVCWLLLEKVSFINVQAWKKCTERTSGNFHPGMKWKIKFKTKIWYGKSSSLVYYHPLLQSCQRHLKSYDFSGDYFRYCPPSEVYLVIYISNGVIGGDIEYRYLYLQPPWYITKEVKNRQKGERTANRAFYCILLNSILCCVVKYCIHQLKYK